MNVSQQKQVIAVAKKALALLNPEWSISQSLREQLELAMVESVPVRKSGKIKKYQPYKPFTAEDKLIKHVFEGQINKFGRVESPEWKDTTCQCIGCRIGRGFYVDRGMAPIKMMRPERVLETPESIKDRLTLCACGHGSAAHKEDELNNLLECSAMDCGCDHFHYETADDQQIAA